MAENPLELKARAYDLQIKLDQLNREAQPVSNKLRELQEKAFPIGKELMEIQKQIHELTGESVISEEEASRVIDVAEETKEA
jgi:peptidoglycan hydrolase CwlO-like protein